MVWARSDRSFADDGRSATTDSFADIWAATVIDVLPESDFTGKVLLEDLPAGQTFSIGSASRPLRPDDCTANRDRPFPDRVRQSSRPLVRLVRRHGGQGWGIDEARGGMRTFATMRDIRPDFFIHSGDSIYADCPIPRSSRSPTARSGGTSSPRRSRSVAETLADFRGNYKYNLLDANVRAFNAEVPTFAQWDDHEVANDWSPGQNTVPLRQRQRAAARRARQARLSRIHADARDIGRAGPHLPQDRLRTAARRVPDRHA